MKIICVPKDKVVEENLDFDNATPDELIELSLNETEFYSVFRSGFFKAINRITGSIIDDFEDDQVTDKSHLKAVLNSNIFDTLGSNDELKEIADTIKTLFREALERGTGVYFFF